jgi:hypothetical protein
VIYYESLNHHKSTPKGGYFANLISVESMFLNRSVMKPRHEMHYAGGVESGKEPFESKVKQHALKFFCSLLPWSSLLWLDAVVFPGREYSCHCVSGG